jgi:hypothetical protein
MVLAIALVAVVSLTIALVILANADGPGTATPAADGRTDSAHTESRVPSHALEHGGAPVLDLRVAPLPNRERYDGGPEEGSRGATR